MTSCVRFLWRYLLLKKSEWNFWGTNNENANDFGGIYIVLQQKRQRLANRHKPDETCVKFSSASPWLNSPITKKSSFSRGFRRHNSGRRIWDTFEVSHKFTAVHELLAERQLVFKASRSQIWNAFGTTAKYLGSHFGENTNGYLVCGENKKLDAVCNLSGGQNSLKLHPISLGHQRPRTFLHYRSVIFHLELKSQFKLHVQCRRHDGAP